tara:strand:- start:2240 stop:2743 length:504 start_codon:yes stop_codon:yes gene_type:complete
MNFTTPEEEYLYLYKRMADLCKEQSWGDPFSYARSKEIYAAIKLGHTVAPTLAGADGYGPDGSPKEYKSTTGKNCKGSYTGVSNQDTWEEQVKYLKEEKILPYDEHFYNRFTGGKLVESWSMTGQKVYDVLLPKFHKQYHDGKKRKDPRLNADITWTEIKKHGKRVI